MVVVSDNIGRPLYVHDHEEGRLHPYTYEKVDDNFEYQYPNSEELSNGAMILIPIFLIASLSTLIFGIIFILCSCSC